MNHRLAWSNRRLIKNLLLGVFVAALFVRAWVTLVAWLESAGGGGGGSSSLQSVDDVDRALTDAATEALAAARVMAANARTLVPNPKSLIPSRRG